MNPDITLLQDSPHDQKKWMEFFGGKTSPDLGLWRSRLLASFGLTPLTKTRGTGRAAIQLLYMPSFHPECCITIIENDDGARVFFVTHSTNLWQWLGHTEEFCRILRERLPSYTFPTPPKRFAEQGTATGMQFSEFIQKLPSKVPLPVSHSFMDGIGLSGEYRNITGELQSFYLLGQSDPASFDFALAVCDLALEVLVAPETRKILERTARYLDSSLS